MDKAPARGITDIMSGMLVKQRVETARLISECPEIYREYCALEKQVDIFKQDPALEEDIEMQRQYWELLIQLYSTAEKLRFRTFHTGEELVQASAARVIDYQRRFKCVSQSFFIVADKLDALGDPQAAALKTEFADSILPQYAELIKNIGQDFQDKISYNKGIFLGEFKLFHLARIIDRYGSQPKKDHFEDCLRSYFTLNERAGKGIQELLVIANALKKFIGDPESIKKVQTLRAEALAESPHDENLKHFLDTMLASGPHFNIGSSLDTKKIHKKN